MLQMGEELADHPFMERVRRNLLEQALAYYQDFLHERSSDPELRLKTAEAYRQVGHIHNLLGQHPLAVQDYEQSVALCRELAVQFPDVPLYRRRLAISHEMQGMSLHRLGRMPEAERTLRQALTVQEAVVAQCSEADDQHNLLGGILNNLALVLYPQERLKEARAFLERAIDHQQIALKINPHVPLYRTFLRNHHGLMGAVLWKSSELADAERSWRAQVRLGDQLMQEFPNVRAHRAAQSDALKHLANLLAELRRTQDAEPLLRQALDLDRALAASFPAVPNYQNSFVDSQYNLARLLVQTNRRQEATQNLRQALQIQERLVVSYPTEPAYRDLLARAHNNLAYLLAAGSQPEQAEGPYRRALALQEALVAENPNVPDYRSALAATLNNLALLSRSGKDLREARQLLERAVRLQEEALECNPKNARFRQFLRNHCFGLADTLLRLGEHVEASRAAERLPTLYPKGWSEYRQAAAFLARCAACAGTDSKLPEEERRRVAQGYGDRVLALLRQAVAQGYRDHQDLLGATAFDSIRPRVDFQKLLTELEAMSPKS
jgi:tetratricopeptide (TPR) repeat protein